MKRRLPARILVSTAVPAFGLAVLLAIFPMWTALVICALILLTLAGGAMVARDASAQASDRAPATFNVLVKGADRFWLTWAIATSVLWVFCAPDLYFRDGGELAGAAATLGVPHPTGFPLLCMGGRLATLFPFGNMYFRLNLLSGLAAGGAAAFAWRFLAKAAYRSSSRPEPLWWVAPAVYLGSATAWLHAVTTEIYSLSTLGLAATVCLAVEGARRRDARLIAVSGALCGVGLGGHVTWPVYGIPAVALCGVWFAFTGEGSRSARAWATVRLAAVCVLFAAAGATLSLYLPAAAGRDPLLNWGNPSDIGRFVAHVTGQRIRSSFGDSSGFLSANPAVLEANFSMALRTFVNSTGPLLPFAAVGVVAALTRFVPAALVLVGVVVADFAFAVVVNPMGIRDLQVLLSATWATAVLSGIGVSATVAAMKRRAGVAGAAAAGCFAVMLVVFQWFSATPDRDMSGTFGPREITDRLLDNAAWGSVVMTASDDMSSSLMGRSAVEDARPDMVFLVKQHLLDTGFVVRRLTDASVAGRLPGGGASDPADAARNGIVESILAHPFESTGETPSGAVTRAVALFSRLGDVYVEPGETAADQGIRNAIIPDFPIWRVTRGRPADVEDSKRAWRSAMSANEGLDRWGRAWLAEWLRLLGTAEAMKTPPNPAEPILRSALAVDPDDFRAAHNLGVILADSDRPGSMKEALTLLTGAVAESPAYVRGWETLAKNAAKAGLEQLSKEASAQAAALKRDR